MKKFLALVLALVMTMSLVTISAGAEDFTDADKVTYAEAVDVMTAAGVVGGYADGSFNPTAGLTRGAAAKIICNMILGPTTAEALVANDAPFSDVAADNVFAGYIAYCVNEGIISGYADGTFKPAAPLTGYAFMKMLLGALGYDAVNEGYVGTNWSIQVAKRALAIGLDSGLKGDFAGAKALTREEACLYAFNTMKATMVEYDNDSKITVGDIVISNSSKAEEITVGDSLNPEAGSNYIDNGTLQFVEKYFEKLVYTSSDPDAFGRPAHSWDYDNEDVGAYVDAADVVFTAETELDDVVKALKGYKFEGVKVVDKTTAADATGFTCGELAIPASTSIAATVKGLTANGQLVELYFNKYNELYDAVVVSYTVDEVVKVVEKKDKTTYTFDVAGAKIDWVDEDKVDELTFEGTLEKGDIVTTVMNDAGTKLYVYATDSFEGAQTSYNTTKKTITVAGDVYTVATGVSDGTDLVAMADFNNSAKEDNTYYVDQYGFVVKTTAASASSDFALILDVYAKLDTTIDGSTPSVQVRAALEDGTVGVYDVALKKITATGATNKGDYQVKNMPGIVVFDKDASPAWADADTKSAAAALDGNVYGYTLNGNTITLENAFEALAQDKTSLLAYGSDSIAEDETSVVCGTDTVLLTKTTAIVVVDTDTNVAKVYNGTADLGNNLLTGFQAVVTGKSATLAQAEVVFVEKAGGLVAETENYAFVDVSKVAVNLNGDEVTYTYTAVLPDGDTLVLVAEDALTEDGLYAYSAENEVAPADLLEGVVTGSADQYFFADVTVSGDMMTSDSVTYFDISAADVVYVDDPQVLDEVDGNKCFFVVTVDDGAPTKTVETIFVYAV